MNSQLYRGIFSFLVLVNCLTCFPSTEGSSQTVCESVLTSSESTVTSIESERFFHLFFRTSLNERKILREIFSSGALNSPTVYEQYVETDRTLGVEIKLESGKTFKLKSMSETEVLIEISGRKFKIKNFSRPLGLSSNPYRGTVRLSHESLSKLEALVALEKNEEIPSDIYEDDPVPVFLFEKKAVVHSGKAVLEINHENNNEENLSITEDLLRKDLEVSLELIKKKNTNGGSINEEIKKELGEASKFKSLFYESFRTDASLKNSLEKIYLENRGLLKRNWNGESFFSTVSSLCTEKIQANEARVASEKAAAEDEKKRREIFFSATLPRLRKAFENPASEHLGRRAFIYEASAFREYEDLLHSLNASGLERLNETVWTVYKRSGSNGLFGEIMKHISACRSK